MTQTWKTSKIRIQTWLQSHLLPHYQQLQDRDKKMLQRASIILLLIVLVFGLLLPLNDRQKELQKEFDASRIQAHEAQQLARRIIHSGDQRQQAGSIASMLRSIEQNAQKYAVRSSIQRMKPQSNSDDGKKRLLLQMHDVAYKDFIPFMQALSKQGLSFTELHMQASDKKGRVHIRAQISSN